MLKNLRQARRVTAAKTRFVARRTLVRLLPIGAALALAACAGGTADLAGTNPGPMPLGPPVGAPLGASAFCHYSPTECEQPASTVAAVDMTQDRRRELESVQQSVDNGIAPRLPTNSSEVAWHYATDGAGDCVQYALEKRRALLERGWPAGALHLVTASTATDVRHLVLVVSTSDGDWVLDNLHTDIVPWSTLPYEWIARQQGPTLRDWVSVARTDNEPAFASLRLGGG
jgi:predicted transglutaminase-like cysteine proteinase